MFGVRGMQLASHNVCGMMCVCGEDLAAIPSLLPSPLGPQRCPVTFCHGPPQAKLPLPFALHPPHFDQGLCLGFPAEQAFDRQAAGDVVLWEPLFFSFWSVSCFGLGFGGGRGEDARVVGLRCLLPPHNAPQRGGVQAQAMGPGWYPQWCLLGARAAWAGHGPG